LAGCRGLRSEGIPQKFAERKSVGFGSSERDKQNFRGEGGLESREFKFLVSLPGKVGEDWRRTFVGQIMFKQKREGILVNILKPGSSLYI
jgi:hypothetical protein